MVGMDKVGERFAAGKMFISDVYMSKKAFKACLELIQPYLKSDDMPYKGKIVEFSFLKVLEFNFLMLLLRKLKRSEFTND